MTPIARVFRKVLQDERQVIQQRKLLILLATDGVPTNDDGAANPQELYYILSRERNPIDRIPVTIISCTGKRKYSVLVDIKYVVIFKMTNHVCLI